MTGFIPAPIKPEITMDHLEKVDIRTGLIKKEWNSFPLPASSSG